LNFSISGTPTCMQAVAAQLQNNLLTMQWVV
jgi:hypothetical protein